MPLDWATEFTHAGLTAGAALVASFFGTKWAEERRLQARFEKLDQILEEMREVGRAQEEIKRQIQGGEWNRQMLWKQRLDSYTELLRVTTDYMDRCYAVRSLLESGAEGKSDLRDKRDEMQKLRTNTFKAITVVEIFGDADVLSTLKSFFEAARDNSGLSAAEISRDVEAIRTLQTRFVSAARKQLKGGIDQ